MGQLRILFYVLFVFSLIAFSSLLAVMSVESIKQQQTSKEEIIQEEAFEVFSIVREPGDSDFLLYLLNNDSTLKPLSFPTITDTSTITEVNITTTKNYSIQIQDIKMPVLVIKTKTIITEHGKNFAPNLICQVIKNESCADSSKSITSDFELQLPLDYKLPWGGIDDVIEKKKEINNAYGINDKKRSWTHYTHWS